MTLEGLLFLALMVALVGVIADELTKLLKEEPP